MSEQATSAAGAALAQGFAAQAATLRRAAELLVAVAAVMLLGYIYFKTQSVDFKRRNEVLAQFRDLKEIDARWDVDILRTRTEFTSTPLPATDYSAEVARIRQQLAPTSQDLDSPVLKRSVDELTSAFTQKAELVDKFRKANAATKEALVQVLAADAEIAGLVRGSWQDFRERERLVAAESAVTQLTAEAQRYYFSPSDAQRKNVEALVSDLRQSASQLPPAVREGLARLDGNVQQLLGAKPVEEELARKLSLLTAGPRVDSLTKAFAHELEKKLSETVEPFRAYLTFYSVALLVLIAYLATRLVASYRRLDRANADLNDRIAERNGELSKTLHELKESEAQLMQTDKMSSLGQMVAGVAHEINTPLAYVKNSIGSIRGKLPDLAGVIGETEKLVTLLQSGSGDNPDALARQFTLVQKGIAQLRERELIGDLQTLVKDGLHGIEQISEIVVNLKNFSRLDHSKIASFSLNEGLESTLLLAKHDLKRYTVQKHYGEDVPPITCSAAQINQVLLNLIINAAQSIESEQGTITLTTRREDDGHIAVEVEDNGRGIPPDVLPKIFEPYFTTKEAGKGTGLGLSISHKIVEQHGGRITVDSAVGIGTKFKVVLPLTPPAAAGLAA
ncbi:MAG TPA: ATP-binding protein [Burkholderiales bacterium]|nr:ATP-binding protein [Burkholderiales bacterium]